MSKKSARDLRFLAILSVFLLGIFAFGKIRLATAVTTHLVISEVQIAGGGGVNEDFVEIYNPTDSSYDLNGHRLVKRTATGTSDSSVKAWSSETIVPAHGYYLWANSTWTPSVTPDATTAATLAADNGVALRQGAEDTGTIIDSVAWGTVTNAFVETSPFATNPEAGTSIERLGDDTNNNSVDFSLQQSPNPQNLVSVPTPTATTEPSTTPTETITPTPTDEVSPTPTEEITPTPTEDVSPTPTEELTPTPTETVTPTVSPQPTAQPTPPPSPTPTPGGKVIGKFHFPGRTITCTLSYKIKVKKFFFMIFPVISCK